METAAKIPQVITAGTRQQQPQVIIGLVGFTGGLSPTKHGREDHAGIYMQPSQAEAVAVGNVEQQGRAGAVRMTGATQQYLSQVPSLVKLQVHQIAEHAVAVLAHA